MDTDMVKFITEQNKDLKEDFIKQNIELKADLKEIVDINGTFIRATMKAEVDRIDEMDRLRNDRIGKNEGCIEEIKEQTAVWRWMHVNPLKSAIIMMSLFAGLAYGYHKINLPKTIENTTGIVIDNETVSTAEREPKK